MSMDRIFLVFAVLVGGASGAILVLIPGSRNIGVEPYFWVLIAFVLFESVLFARRGFAAGPPIAMPTRLVGFFLAMLLMFAIPLAAGVDVKYF
jgi:hypothetical protein